MQESLKYGIKIQHLNSFIEKCGGRNSIQKISTADICKNHLKPLTEPSKSSYCDMLAKSKNANDQAAVGIANVFVCHAWKYIFLEVVDALLYHFRDQADVIIWFDVFSYNQHGGELDKGWWSNSLPKIIQDINHTVMVWVAWNHAIPLSRTWCLYELYCSIVGNTKKLEIVMNGEQERHWYENMSEIGEKVMNEILGGINIEKSDCTSNKEKDMILEVLKEKAAGQGFEKCNEMIIHSLRDWMLASVLKEIDTENDQEDFLKDEMKIVSLQTITAHLYTQQNNYNKAEEYFLSALELLKSMYGITHIEIIRLNFQLGQLYTKVQRFSEASKLFQVCYESNCKVYGPDHPDSKLYRTSCAELEDKGKEPQSDKSAGTSTSIDKQNSTEASSALDKLRSGVRRVVSSSRSSSETVAAQVASSSTATSGTSDSTSNITVQTSSSSTNSSSINSEQLTSPKMGNVVRRVIVTSSKKSTENNSNTTDVSSVSKSTVVEGGVSNIISSSSSKVSLSSHVTTHEDHDIAKASGSLDFSGNSLSNVGTRQIVSSQKTQVMSNQSSSATNLNDTSTENSSGTSNEIVKTRQIVSSKKATDNNISDDSTSVSTLSSEDNTMSTNRMTVGSRRVISSASSKSAEDQSSNVKINSTHVSTNENNTEGGTKSVIVGSIAQKNVSANNVSGSSVSLGSQRFVSSANGKNVKEDASLLEEALVNNSSSEHKGLGGTNTIVVRSAAQDSVFVDNVVSNITYSAAPNRIVSRNSESVEKDASDIKFTLTDNASSEVKGEGSAKTLIVGVAQNRHVTDGAGAVDDSNAKDSKTTFENTHDKVRIASKSEEKIRNNDGASHATYSSTKNVESSNVEGISTVVTISADHLADEEQTNAASVVSVALTSTSKSGSVENNFMQKDQSKILTEATTDNLFAVQTPQKDSASPNLAKPESFRADSTTTTETSPDTHKKIVKSNSWSDKKISEVAPRPISDDELGALLMNTILDTEQSSATTTSSSVAAKKLLRSGVSEYSLGSSVESLPSLEKQLKSNHSNHSIHSIEVSPISVTTMSEKSRDDGAVVLGGIISESSNAIPVQRSSSHDSLRMIDDEKRQSSMASANASIETTKISSKVLAINAINTDSKIGTELTNQETDKRSNMQENNNASPKKGSIMDKIKLFSNNSTTPTANPTITVPSSPKASGQSGSNKSPFSVSHPASVGSSANNSNHAVSDLPVPADGSAHSQESIGASGSNAVSGKTIKDKIKLFNVNNANNTGNSPVTSPRASNMYGNVNLKPVNNNISNDVISASNLNQSSTGTTSIGAMGNGSISAVSRTSGPFNVNLKPVSSTSGDVLSPRGGAVYGNVTLKPVSASNNNNVTDSNYSTAAVVTNNASALPTITIPSPTATSASGHSSAVTSPTTFSPAVTPSVAANNGIVSSGSSNGLNELGSNSGSKRGSLVSSAINIFEKKDKDVQSPNNLNTSGGTGRPTWTPKKMNSISSPTANTSSTPSTTPTSTSTSTQPTITNSLSPNTTSTMRQQSPSKSTHNNANEIPMVPTPVAKTAVNAVEVGEKETVSTYESINNVANSMASSSATAVNKSVEKISSTTTSAIATHDAEKQNLIHSTSGTNNFATAVTATATINVALSDATNVAAKPIESLSTTPITDNATVINESLLPAHLETRQAPLFVTIAPLDSSTSIPSTPPRTNTNTPPFTNSSPDKLSSASSSPSSSPSLKGNQTSYASNNTTNSSPSSTASPTSNSNQGRMSITSKIQNSSVKERQRRSNTPTNAAGMKIIEMATKNSVLMNKRDNSLNNGNGLPPSPTHFHHDNAKSGIALETSSTSSIVNGEGNASYDSTTMTNKDLKETGFIQSQPSTLRNSAALDDLKLDTHDVAKPKMMQAMIVSELMKSSVSSNVEDSDPEDIATKKKITNSAAVPGHLQRAAAVKELRGVDANAAEEENRNIKKETDQTIKQTTPEINTATTQEAPRASIELVGKSDGKDGIENTTMGKSDPTSTTVMYSCCGCYCLPRKATQKPSASSRGTPDVCCGCCCYPTTTTVETTSTPCCICC